jgi:membrane-bound inhibitor of C-type lysozyme
MENKILCLASAAVLPFASCSPSNVASSPKPGNSVAIYVSDTGERLTATYDIRGHTVRVILPDKKQVDFYQAISASGARYTNEAGTFWEHQGEATCSIGDAIIFVGKKSDLTNR